MKQLALPFAEEQNFAPEDFCPAPSNAAAREWLARPESWSQSRLVLWGEAGCGKSHLLHIWARSQGAMLLCGTSLPELPRLASAIASAIAVDDAELAPEPRALLHLLNAAHEAGQPVLLATRLPPARLPYKLADLTSRLRASAAVEIRPPEEALLAQLLTKLAAQRQLALSIPVRNVLLLHLPRSPAFYREAVARLDRVALDQNVKITRGLTMEIIADLVQDD